MQSSPCAVLYSNETMTAPRIDALLAPGYAADLSKLDSSELRRRRSECNEEEVGLSYLRRMVQGRLDIVLAEQRRRVTGVGGADVASLVERLPEILSEKVHAPGFGRLPAMMAPTDVGHQATLRLDAIAPLVGMGSLPDLADDALAAMADAIAQLEKDVSSQRRRLHEVIDLLQEEVIRRYRSGEADANSLLK